MRAPRSGRRLCRMSGVAASLTSRTSETDTERAFAIQPGVLRMLRKTHVATTCARGISKRSANNSHCSCRLTVHTSCNRKRTYALNSYGVGPPLADALAGSSAPTLPRRPTSQPRFAGQGEQDSGAVPPRLTALAKLSRGYPQLIPLAVHDGAAIGKVQALL